MWVSSIEGGTHTRGSSQAGNGDMGRGRTVRTYTTCPGCGEYLLHLGRRNTTHALCVDPEEHAWRLEDEFLAAASAGDEGKADKLAALLDGLNSGPPRLLDAALVYASWGWPVFPLKPGTKVPATQRGFKDATTDPAAIRDWWRRTPQANVGIPTGVVFDVLDVDFKHGVWQRWLTLRESTHMPTAHGLAITASGGLHVLLLPTGAGNGTNIFDQPGLDYRGKGGYVVVAPSVLADGRTYAWWAKPSPMVKAASVGVSA